MKEKDQQQKKKKGRSTQDLIGIKTFTKYGLAMNKGELIYYSVAPTNISVLSTVPDIEILCSDSCECFDDNKASITHRLSQESNPMVRKVLNKDRDFLDNIQIEMSTARQFFFTARMKAHKDEQVFQAVNRIKKVISEQGFEVRQLTKNEIKRFLAIYFDASMNGDQMADMDGGNCFTDVSDE